MFEEGKRRELDDANLIQACKRVTAFLREEFDLDIKISVADIEDMKSAFEWEDYFNWRKNFSLAEDSKSTFFLKLEHEGSLVALCEGFVHGQDSDGEATATIDALEKDRKNQSELLKGLVVPFFVEACRQIAKVEKLETVFCACIDPKPAEKTLPIYHRLGFKTKYNSRNGGYEAIRNAENPINWSAFQR